MARTGADPRRLLAVTPLVVCLSGALVHASVIVLPALLAHLQRGDGKKAARISASSGYARCGVAWKNAILRK